jgi:hypothetical protein
MVVQRGSGLFLKATIVRDPAIIAAEIVAFPETSELLGKGGEAGVGSLSSAAPEIRSTGAGKLRP